MTKKPRAKRTPVRLKHDRPDLTDWQLDALEKFREALLSTTSVIEEATNEAIRMAFESKDSGVSWAAEWTDENGHCDPNVFRDDPPTLFVDPLTMRLTIALGPDADNEPVYEFNLRDAIADTLDTCREDGSFSEGLKRISSALRKLSDDINDAVANGDK